MGTTNAIRGFDTYQLLPFELHVHLAYFQHQIHLLLQLPHTKKRLLRPGRKQLWLL